MLLTVEALALTVIGAGYAASGVLGRPENRTATVLAGVIVLAAGLLLLAGFETTANLIGNAVVVLQRRRDLWARLTADPAAGSNLSAKATTIKANCN